MLPAATECSSGFHRCVRARSISVTSARPCLASVSPSFVTSPSPAAPPPTTTMRCTPGATTGSPSSASRRSRADVGETSAIWSGIAGTSAHGSSKPAQTTPAAVIQE